VGLDVAVKPDQTLVTAGDYASQTAMLVRARQVVPDVPFMPEEAFTEGLDTWLAGYGGELLGLGDPADGTVALAAGTFTSTVGAGFYDLMRGRLVASAVVSPIAGLGWWTAEGRPTS
jgi:3'-phosphoadenosine 5'-phosphosulfate (PAPS) 3'-phosphatase